MTRRCLAYVGLASVLMYGCNSTKTTSDETVKSQRASMKTSVESVLKSSKLDGTQPSVRPNSVKDSAPESTSKSAIHPKLPGASRVFAVDLDGDGQDEVLGARTGEIWAYRVVESGFQPLWTLKGEGTVHYVAVGKIGPKNKVQSSHLYVAWGVARGALNAPLAVERIAPVSGQRIRLWEHSGPRNEPAHLGIEDVDGDDVLDLAFAYYSGKYLVKPYHFTHEGGVKPGRELRMASTRAYGRLFPDNEHSEVIGRVYGDARGVVGDLRILSRGRVQKIPTENGVRSVLIAQVGDDKGAHLYFADGWVADYGKSAKAQVKRVRTMTPSIEIESVGTSGDEFTFFNLASRDLDGDGRSELIARGNKGVSVFRQENGTWHRSIVAQLPPVLNAAILKRSTNKFFVVVPNENHVALKPLVLEAARQ